MRGQWSTSLAKLLAGARYLLPWLFMVGLALPPMAYISHGFAVMNVQSMDDDIGNELDCDARPISNVDVGSTGINGLEAVHDELLLQLYNHVTLEHNPQGLLLDNSVAKSARLGVHRVIITSISDNIESTITATNGIAPKSYATISKSLAVLLPIGITTPAIINWVTSPT
nr:hypothetical protein CR513_45203 [Ipomoea batatas]